MKEKQGKPLQGIRKSPEQTALNALRLQSPLTWPGSGLSFCRGCRGASDPGPGLPGCLCNAREGYLNAKKGAGSWLLLRALFVWILVFLTPQPGVQLPVDWPLKQWKNKQPWEPWALPGMGVSAEDSGGSSHWHREILSTVSLTKAHLELTDAWCDPLCWTGAADTVKKVVNSTFPSYPDPKLQWAHCRVIY